MPGRTPSWCRFPKVAAPGSESFCVPTLPRVAFTHDLWEHWYYARLKDRLRGKYLVPRRVCRDKPIILLVRDPRDVVVPLSFQVTRRDQSYRGHWRAA
jgi:hypothetical protein